MMASAMMADTTGGVGTVADLAPTMTMGLKVKLVFHGDGGSKVGKLLF